MEKKHYFVMQVCWYIRHYGSSSLTNTDIGTNKKSPAFAQHLKILHSIAVTFSFP